MMHRDRSDLAVLIVPIVIWLCIAYALLGMPLEVNHDVALNLSLAQKILDGQTPYVDFIEINPPLVFYLNIPPILVGDAIGVNPIVVFHVLSLALCVWSTLSIRRSMIALELPGRGVVLAVWAGLAWLVHSSGDFAQREQHFVLAYVPFLLLRVARWSDQPVPRRRAIAVGVLAGLMTTLKPQFVLVAFIPELVWWVRQRRATPLKAPECVAAFAVGLAYLLHFAIWRSMMTGYFGWLPELMHGYSAFKAPWSRLLDPTLVVWPAASVCVALVARPLTAREPASEWRIALAVFTAAAFVLIYVWPRVIFPYHFEPARHAAIVLIAFMIATTAHRISRPIAAVVGVATVVFATSVILRTRSAVPSSQHTAKLAAFIESRTRPGDSVMWLNCAVPPAYPLLVQIDRRNASRYSFLAWIFTRSDERQFIANVRADMARDQPNVLIVPRDCMGRRLPMFLAQSGLMTDAFAGFEEVDATAWGGALPIVVYERR
jgi:hypothetical protein